jgi:hypothetical protein
MAIVVDKARAWTKPESHIPAPARSASMLKLTDGVDAPSTTNGYALIYADKADGDLKVKFGDGTTKVVAADS